MDFDDLHEAFGGRIYEGDWIQSIEDRLGVRISRVTLWRMRRAYGAPRGSTGPGAST